MMFVAEKLLHDPAVLLFFPVKRLEIAFKAKLKVFARLGLLILKTNIENLISVIKFNVWDFAQKIGD